MSVVLAPDATAAFTCLLALCREDWTVRVFRDSQGFCCRAIRGNDTTVVINKKTLHEALAATYEACIGAIG